jgi:hypothetical protein
MVDRLVAFWPPFCGTLVIRRERSESQHDPLFIFYSSLITPSALVRPHSMRHSLLLLAILWRWWRKVVAANVSGFPQWRQFSTK